MVLYHTDFITYKDVYLVYYNTTINEISFSKNKMEWHQISKLLLLLLWKIVHKI